jgi:hydroxymethylglutaryl-CoA reductase (NADPH)
LDKNWTKNLQPKKGSKISIPRGYGKQQIEERWKLLNSSNDRYKEYTKVNGDKLKQTPGYRTPMEELLDKDTFERCDIYKDNCENMIGTVKIPVGLAGPIRVNGLFAQGEY